MVSDYIFRSFQDFPVARETNAAKPAAAGPTLFTAELLRAVFECVRTCGTISKAKMPLTRSMVRKIYFHFIHKALCDHPKSKILS